MYQFNNVFFSFRGYYPFIALYPVMVLVPHFLFPECIFDFMIVLSFQNKFFLNIHLFLGMLFLFQISIIIIFSFCICFHRVLKSIGFPFLQRKFINIGTFFLVHLCINSARKGLFIFKIVSHFTVFFLIKLVSRTACSLEGVFSLFE